MAKLYGEIAAKALLTLDKSFARANGQPLDASEVYYSLQAARDYAATAQAYIGQKIVVIENGIVSHYSVEDTAGTLKELGSKPVADGTTVAIGADGKITLANIAEENKTGTYNAVLVNGALTWVKPSETTVEGLSDLIQALTGRMDTAEADIDALQASVGVASKPESVEGAGDAVAATGLHKAVEDEVARAKAAEKALDERIDGIDFVDTNELATALEPYAKTADLPVTGVAADDKVLSLTDKLVSATVSLGYDEVNKAIKLYGKDSVELGSVDATPFIKDGMLSDVEYNAENNTLTFTWNTDSGDKTDTVVLSDIIEPYTAGVGLELVGNEFKAKLADGSEGFLTITADGIKLSGIADAIATAKSEAIADAASAAAGIYATQTALGELETALDERLDVLEAIDHTAYTTNTVFDEYKTEVSNTYATQTVVNEISQVANNAAAKVDTLEDKVEEITSVGGEPNVIDYIKVNGSILEVEKDEEGNSTKTVNIAVPTKFTDLTDDSGFDARITAAQNKANEAADAASAAQGTANEANAAAEANATAIGSLNTTVAGHTNTIGEHTTAIANLQNADTQHAAEYASLKGTVEGHTSTIATLATQSSLDAVSAKASANETAIKTINETTIPGLNTEIGKKANATDVYTKSEIDGKLGEIGDKTVIELINEAKSEASYDDTEVRGLITTETDRAKAAEKANADAIAKLASDVGNVANIMNFVGAKDEIPTDNTDYENGDVIIVGNQEYVFDGSTWQAFGDASVNGALISALDTRVTANETAIAAINNTESGILATAKGYTDAQIAAIPAATAEALGLVKVDNVTIQANDGVISVKEVSTDLLKNGSEPFTINGGGAKA